MFGDVPVAVAVVVFLSSVMYNWELNNHDDGAEDDAKSKMKLYSTGSEIRDCLDLFGAPIALKTRLS